MKKSHDKKILLKRRALLVFIFLAIGIWFFFFRNDTEFRREFIGDGWLLYSNQYLSFEYPGILQETWSLEPTLGTELKDVISRNKLTYIFPLWGDGMESYEEHLGATMGRRHIYDFDTFVKDSLQKLHPNYSTSQIEQLYHTREETITLPTPKSVYQRIWHIRNVKIKDFDTLSFRTEMQVFEFDWLNKYDFKLDTVDNCFRKIYRGDIHGCIIQDPKSGIAIRMELNPNEKLSEDQTLRVLKSIRMKKDNIKVVQ